MNLVIMQPSYLPWLGYFDLFFQADLFLYYDDVQFDKNGWRNRNRIKTPSGPQWLTVPVLTKGQHKPTNREIQVNDKDPWRRKHFKSIEMNYKKAPHHEEVLELIRPIYGRSWENLYDLIWESNKRLCEYLEIKTKVKTVSELGMALPEGKNEKLIALCKEVGADKFYEPAGGKGYIDPQRFKQSGIELTFQDFHSPVYPQLHGDFIPQLSILDVLFNCGKDSAQYLRAQRTSA